MSAIVTELLTAINTAITGDATITGATSYQGFGLAPTGTTGTWLTWFIVGGDNGDFMRANTDYYKEVDIQFTSHTENPSPAASISVIELVEALFRFNDLTLSSGRNFSNEIGSPVTVEDPEADGWNTNTTITFSIGT